LAQPDTAATASVDLATGRLRITESGPGDGTVLRSSALMDERQGGQWVPKLRSPIDWKDVHFHFRSHLDLTKDQGFADNVLFILLQKSRQKPGATASPNS